MSTKEEKLISVIVPVYKVPDYLDICVQSIVDSDYKNLEILLVDDGSPDNCGEMCEEWAKKDERIKVIHKENGGLSDARNYGIEASTGEILSFIDSDDWIEPDMFSKLMSTMEETGADYCACNIYNYYESTGLEDYSTRRDYFVGGSEEAIGRLYDDAKFPNSTWCKLVKKEAWGDLRFPVGKLYEDGFITYLIIDKAEKIAQIPDPLYHYRIREGSIMTSAFSMKHMDMDEVWRTNYEFAKEHYPMHADAARSFWLVHLPQLIREFPKEMTQEEKAAKKHLKKEIRQNLFFVLRRMGIKKFYYQVKALIK